MIPMTRTAVAHAVRPLLGGLAAVLLVAGAAAWVAPLQANAVIRTLRFAAPLGAVALYCVRAFALPSGDTTQDLLAQVTPAYFDRGGLSFAPKFVMDGGSCYLCIYFQNPFRGPATAIIDFQPPTGWLGRGTALAGATVSVEVPGGAFGVAWL